MDQAKRTGRLVCAWGETVEEPGLHEIREAVETVAISDYEDEAWMRLERDDAWFLQFGFGLIEIGDGERIYRHDLEPRMMELVERFLAGADLATDTGWRDMTPVLARTAALQAAERRKSWRNIGILIALLMAGALALGWWLRDRGL